jgi:hypothetical protein
VFDMMFGSFDLQYFRKASNPPLVIAHFVLFMVIVPTVMLNALIAIMGDTFARVKQHMIAAGRLERAKIILELERMLITPVEYTEQAPYAQTPVALSWRDRLRVALTCRVTHASPVYLHVLQPIAPQSGEVTWESRICVKVDQTIAKVDRLTEDSRGTDSKVDKLQHDVCMLAEDSRGTDSKVNKLHHDVCMLQQDITKILTLLEATSQPAEPQPEPEPEPELELEPDRDAEQSTKRSAN